jgi:hypothetical protein
VALCGDMLAVGSPGDGESSPNGAVHLFRQHGDDSYDWDEVRRIVPQGTGLTRGFGLSLALAENWLAVGYPLAGTGGQVRMYARNIGTPDAWSPRGILENPAASEDDLFGRSLSLDGSWLAVGAPSAKGVRLVNFQPVPLDGAGRVYLFEENVGGGSNWGLTVRLPVTVVSNEPFGEANGQFGSSVCLEGTQLAIGAPRENNDRGRVYVHERTIGLGLVTWGKRAELEVPASLPVDRLGQSVCLQDDMVAGGASWLSPQGLGSPVACLFRRNAGGRNVYGYESMAAAAEVRRPDLFRDPDTNLAMWGRQLVMGSPGSPFSQKEGGHVDVFLRQDDRWAMTRSAPALVPAANNIAYVPAVVDLDHEYAAVGYPQTPDTPAVFVLERNQGGAGQWGVVRKITETGADADDFGNSLSLSGRHLAVGAAGASLNGLTSNGAVYVYEQNTSGDNNWGLLVRLAGTQNGAVMGSSVALEGRRMLAGAPGYDVNSVFQSAGAVYVYEYSSGVAPHWSGNAIFTAETPNANEQFGQTVALDGDLAAVGMPTTGAGRISIHRRNEGGLNAWGRSALVQNPFSGGVKYGFRGVSMSGGWLVAGSVKDLNSNWGVGVTNLASVLDPQPPAFNLSTRRVVFPAGVEKAGLVQDISGGTMVAANLSLQDFDGTSLHVFSRNVDGAGAWGWEASINHPNVTALAISGRTILAAGSTSLRVYELSGSGYDNWTRQHFTDASVNNPALEASVWGPVADPDKDGLTNLEEAYGGTSPLASQPELIRQAGRDPVTGEFWFRWRQGGDDQGVRALPQWSVDLQNWRGTGSSLGSPNPVAVNVSIRSSATLDDGMEWEARIPALPAQAVFWRLFLWRE